MVRFAERIGTSGIDSLVGTTSTVTYGLGGSDFMSSQKGSAYNILIAEAGQTSTTLRRIRQSPSRIVAAQAPTFSTPSLLGLAPTP